MRLTTSTAFADNAPSNPSTEKKQDLYNFSEGRKVVLIGVTGSFGKESRFGPEIGLGNLRCGREGLCSGYAFLGGLIRPNTYFAGLGGGLLFYPLSAWGEIGTHIEGNATSGYYAKVALGTIFRPFIGTNYDIERKRTSFEAGLTAKWIFPLRD